MEIRSFGAGRRMRECERLLWLYGGDFQGNFLLLPIPTTRDNAYINGTEITIPEFANLITPESVVVGYNIPQIILNDAENKGARVCDLALDEDFVLQNAKISANGALGYLLTNSTLDPGDMKIGIVGYGRIGKELLRLCLLLGADVVLYTTRESVVLELGEAGVPTKRIDKAPDFSGLDLIFNTAPARLFSLCDLPEETKIIDLASGNIFEQSPRVTKLSSIPDAMFPISAGRICYRTVRAFLERKI